MTDKMDRLLIVTFVWFHLYLEIRSNCWELLFLLLVLVFPCQRLKRFSIVSLWRGLEVIDSLKMVKAVVVGWNPVLSFDSSRMNSWAIERLLLCETSSGFWKPSNELLNFDVPHDNYEQQSWICPNKIFLWWGEQETCKEEKNFMLGRQDIKMTHSTKHWRFSKKDCPGNEWHKWTRDTENLKWGGESILNDTTS